MKINVALRSGIIKETIAGFGSCFLIKYQETDENGNAIGKINIQDISSSKTVNDPRIIEGLKCQIDTTENKIIFCKE